MQANSAIGVFDSGVGGLTVVRAVSERLPGEELIYLGDTARVPYGSKSAETVTRYAELSTRFLLEQHVKMIVVACNTASALGSEPEAQKDRRRNASERYPPPDPLGANCWQDSSLQCLVRPGGSWRWLTVAVRLTGRCTSLLAWPA